MHKKIASTCRINVQRNNILCQGDVVEDLFRPIGFTEVPDRNDGRIRVFNHCVISIFRVMVCVSR